MRLIDRYILREFLLIAVYCLLAFVALQVLFDVFTRFSNLLTAKPPPLLMLRYYLGRVAPSFQFLLPATLLFSTIYTLWNMARHGELTAMRASGISLLRLVGPLMVVALVAVGVVAAVNELVVPTVGAWAAEFSRQGFQWKRARVQLNHAYYNVAARRGWLISRFDVDNPTLLQGVQVTQEREDGSPEKRIWAEQARWLDGVWWFFDVRIQHYNERGDPKGLEVFVPGSPMGTEMRMLTERPGDFVTELKDWDFLSAREMLRYVRRRGSQSGSVLAGEMVELHARFAMPWACLVVTLLGIPVGALSARQNAIRGILLIMLCFFAYYGLTQVFLFLGKRQLLCPWLAAWFSNIIFLAAGVVLLVRTR